MATTENLEPCPDCKRTDGTHDQFHDCWTAEYLRRRPAAAPATEINHNTESGS